MSEAHQIGGSVVLAVTAALLVAAGWSAVEGRRSGGTSDHRFAVDRLLLVAVAGVGLNDVVGLGLLLTGARPADLLHLLYGAAALVTAPGGWWLGGRWRAGRPLPRIRRDVGIAIAAALLLGIELRLFATG